VTVHFNEVCDRFLPFDTTFEIAEAKELKDTKLSAACQLHAASGSTSSSTSSIRRRRLMELAEEEEEEERERKRQSLIQNDGRPGSSQHPSLDAPVKLDAELAKLPEATRFANDSEPPNFTGVPRPSSPTKSFDDSPRRMSSQSSRTDLYPTTSYPYYLKPRVKLAPRPSADAGRPNSSGGSSGNRVATVPAGIKSMSKGSRKTRSQSQGQDDESVAPSIKEQPEENAAAESGGADSGENAIASNGPAQVESTNEDQIPPPTAPAVQVSAAAPAQAPTKQNTMTPEKARLLKAMKLREKKKMMSQQSTTLDVPATIADIPSGPSSPGLPDEKLDPESEGAKSSETDLPQASDAVQDDSATVRTDTGGDVGGDQASVVTTADSSQPGSPLASSEIGDSTQASSVSDSTDETVRAKEELEGGLDDSGPATSEPATVPPTESSPSEKPAEENGTTSGDRQSQITVTAASANNDNAGEPLAPVQTEEEASETPKASATPQDGPASGSQPAADTTSAEATVTPAHTSAVETSSATPGVAQDGKAPSPQLRIPLSKFSTQEPRPPTSTAPTNPPAIVASNPTVDAPRVVEPTPSVAAKDSADTVKVTDAPDAEPAKRRIPEPIRTDIGSGVDNRRSIISITDNNEFMDELQSATVQQATPVTVSKSPISPLFAMDQAAKQAAGGGNATPGPLSARAASNPVRNAQLASTETAPLPTRSASTGAAFLQKIAAQQQQSGDLRPKASTKLGSSISQRIKALEKLSGNTSTAEPPPPRERPASTFFAVRRVPTRDGSRPPSIVDQVSNASPSRPESRDSSPDTTRSMGRGRSGSLVNRLSMFEGGMPPRGKPESVQVTARIVRDPNHSFKGPEPKNSTDYPPLDLKQSQLTVDIQNRPPSSLSREIAIQAKQTLLERRLSRQSQESDRNGVKPEASTDSARADRRSSLSAMKGFFKDRTEAMMGGKSPSTDNLGNSAANQSTSSSRGSSTQQSGSSLARRLSISSRRSSIDQGSGGVEVEDAKSDKKSPSGSGPASPKTASRATRFMRRLSNTLSPGRKNTSPSISPTVTEENAAEVEAASRGSTATGNSTPAPPTIVAFMGDVNVQFPDNLLWKRRSMCLDSQGFLILSATQGSAMLHPPAPGKDKLGALVKRYHMSEFKKPFTPDVELQELPNSVVLDFVSGSGLQVACEDRAGQMNVLRSKYPIPVVLGVGMKKSMLTIDVVLEEAHRQYANYGN
jgi:hypothetical protein